MEGGDLKICLFFFELEVQQITNEERWNALFIRGELIVRWLILYA